MEALDAQARTFVDAYLPSLVRPEMLERIREHRARGHEVVLVSAPPSLYLEKWAKTAGFDAVPRDAAGISSAVPSPAGSTAKTAGAAE